MQAFTSLQFAYGTRGESLLRISLSSAHTVDQMEKLVAVLSR